ncbi:hypothetical protein TNCT_71071 [Trichonephila clavata]|uniref:Uncharacterized protein n=1 Tax=Trichonephila clavata TaxID=2740835 RepID=A0A8X6FIC2_TRICU|nr:hypothetical protein TNCT_71071 [Trichonephila clavata]
MEEYKHSRDEMCLEASNVRDVSQEVCLQNRKIGSSDSEAQNGIPVQEDMRDRFSCVTKYLLLMSLDDCSIYSRLPFMHELEDIEFFGIYEVTNLLALCLFREDFNRILERRSEINTESEMDHAQFLLSRCVLLCREPTYPRFVLTVAFLSNVVVLDVDDLECFRVAYIAEFCLNVLYRRIFWKIFRSREDYQKLRIFCHEFYKQFDLCSAITELRKAPFYVTWQKLIQGCIEDPKIIFPFEESEIEMFCNARQVMNNMECKPEMAWKIENTYFSSLGLRKMQSLCQFCGTKCHNYLTYVSSFISKKLKN